MRDRIAELIAAVRRAGVRVSIAEAIDAAAAAAAVGVDRAVLRDALGATLVTANIGEFSRVRALKVENWLSDVH